MLDYIFREYDIRGVVETELDISNVYRFAQAIAFYFKQERPTMRMVAVGMDGRIHSPAIRDELVRGLRDSGLDVVFIGLCPTPILYFALHTLPIDAGIMITASHNPGQYNGFKICLGKASIFGDAIRTVRDLYHQEKQLSPNQRGTHQYIDVVSSYIVWLAAQFAHLKDMNLSVLVDCGNAVGGVIMPKLIKALSWNNVELLYADVDGTYPNHDADPTIEKNMLDVRKKLEGGRYDLGVGFDGDCDRVGAMTASGYLVPGDQLLALFSKQVLKEHPKTAVVFDIKASSALVDTIKKYDGIPHFSACGHAFIKDEMRTTGALLGGELSCHFCFKDRHFGFDDGIYAALRLFEMIVQSGRSLDEHVAEYPRTVHSPEFRIACAEEKKQDIVTAVKKTFVDRDDAKVITIDGIRAAMPYGWGLLRASNTQPAVSMRFESATVDGLKKVKRDFITAMKPFFDTIVLEKEIDG